MKLTTKERRVQAALKALPATVRIGLRDYEIRVGKPVGDQEGVDGQFWAGSEMIFLSDDCGSSQRVVEVLIHEVMHGVWHEMSCPDQLDEESAVTAVSRGFAGVHRDNPWLSRWIAQYVA